MAIAFDGIPNTRVPFIYVQFDNSRAISASAEQSYRVLLIGQKLDAAKGGSLKPVSIRNAAEVADLFGSGSMLYLMAHSYFENNTNTKTYAIALDDPKDATHTEWTLKKVGEFAGITKLPIFIAGRRLEVVLQNKESNPLQLLGEKISKMPMLPVEALYTKEDDTLHLFCKNKGEQAGTIDIRLAYNDEKQPDTGVRFDIAATTKGVGTVGLDTLLKNIADKQFHVIVNPYTEAATLKLFERDLKERFSPVRQIEGHLISAISGTEQQIEAFVPATVSSPHCTILATGQSSPTPNFEWAAALAGVVASYGQADPARPFNTLPINNVLPDEDENRFPRAARARLLDAGLSTHTVDFNGLVRVERLITTYKNPMSSTDESYLSLNTLLTLSFLRFSFSNYLGAKYPRHKLASDNAFVPPGSPILTPSTARAECVSLFRAWEEAGLVENFEQFKSDLIVERNTKDPTRLDFFMSPRLVSQLNVIGAKISFLI